MRTERDFYWWQIRSVSSILPEQDSSQSSRDVNLTLYDNREITLKMYQLH